MTGEEPDMRAHRLAAEIGRRLSAGQALGKPNLYNIAREVLIEDFAPEHDAAASRDLKIANLLSQWLGMGIQQINRYPTERGISLSHRDELIGAEIEAARAKAQELGIAWDREVMELNCAQHLPPHIHV
jgi:hypothetical protein